MKTILRTVKNQLLDSPGITKAAFNILVSYFDSRKESLEQAKLDYLEAQLSAYNKFPPKSNQERQAVTEIRKKIVEQKAKIQIIKTKDK